MLDMHSRRIFGEPGYRLGLSSLPETTVKAGREGEIQTASLLNLLLGKHNEARVFHSLPWPGSPSSDVDHAFVLGRKVILIDSKKWQKGVYKVDSNTGYLSRDGIVFDEARFRIREAEESWRRILPKESSVSSLVVVHLNHPSFFPDNYCDPSGVQVIVGASLSSTITNLVTEHSGIEWNIIEHIYSEASKTAPGGY